eukprot:g28181.t1
MVRRTEEELEESANGQLKANEECRLMLSKADDLDKKKLTLEKEVKRLYSLLDKLQKDSVAKEVRNTSLFAQEVQTDAFMTIDRMQEEIKTTAEVADAMAESRSRFEALHKVGASRTIKGISEDQFQSEKQQIMQKWWSSWEGHMSSLSPGPPSLAQITASRPDTPMVPSAPRPRLQGAGKSNLSPGLSYFTFPCHSIHKVSCRRRLQCFAVARKGTKSLAEKPWELSAQNRGEGLPREVHCTDATPAKATRDALLMTSSCGKRIASSVPELVGLGAGSTLRLTRTHPYWKRPYTGTIALKCGEIAEDVVQYLGMSEQTPASMGLSVEWDSEAGCVKQAEGWLVTLLPGWEEAEVAVVETNINTFDRMESSGLSRPHDICKHMMRELRGKFQAEQEPTFRCKCSKSRLATAVMMLGKSEVQKILLDKDTQTLYRTILLYFGCFGSLFSGNDSGTV